MSITKYIFFFLFPFLLLVFFLHYKIVGQAAYGDGIYYYAFTRSLYKDHDIFFRNELGHHYSPQNNNASKEEPLGEVTEYTPTGYVSNRYPIGAPLSWIPSFIIADGIAHILHMWDSTISLTGYSDIYQITLGITNVFFVVMGLYLISNILVRYFSSRIVITSLFLITLGTNLFYYASIDVLNSIPFTFLLSSIFLYLFHRLMQKSTYTLYFLCGLVIGMIALTRTQEGIFLLLPVTFIVFELFQIKEKMRAKIVPSIINLTLLTIGFIMVFAFQIAVWYIMYKTFFHSPYITQKDSFTFLQPHLIELIFDRKIGVLWWSPSYIIGFLGLFLFKKTQKIFGWFCVLLCVSEYYLIASWSAWAQGESYSVRMFISSLPFLSFGFASVLEYMQKRWKEWSVYLLCLFFIIFTFARIIYFLGFYQSPTYDLGVNTQSQNLIRFFELFSSH